MQNKQPLINFVRDTLGCTCPNEIFDQIEDTTNTCRQIILGNRLLIYIWAIENQTALETRLPELLAQGKAERDQRGLNRFRLVIVSTQSEQLTAVAEQIFTRCNSDEKIHLHIVPREKVIGL